MSSECNCGNCQHSDNKSLCCLFDELVSMGNICPYYLGDKE